MRKVLLAIAALAAGACLGSPAWALSTLPPVNPLLVSEHQTEGLLLAFNQEGPRWQPQGVLPSGMPEVFLEMARLDGGQNAPAKPQPEASEAEAEVNPELLNRSDLNASVPLPDPAFEFKAGPTLAPESSGHNRGAGSQSLRSVFDLPLAFSASALGGDPPSRPTGGRASQAELPSWLQTSGPLFGTEGRIQEEDGRGGFLALRWNPLRSLGLTLGGGLQRSQAAMGGESTAWQTSPKLAMLSPTDSNSGYANTGHYSRWAAFMAMPYQLNERLGLQPEVSYYYTDMPDLTSVAGNEWVMGLQFTFGF